MAVVDMREYKTREIVRELEQLLDLAKAGRLAGIAYCMQTPRGGEHVGLVGKYKADPGRVMVASTHLYNRARQIIDGGIDGQTSGP